MSVLVEVWGDYACFTRPEMKVERVSYDVITPSAARGLLDAIYWHPGMRWAIDKIYVCKPIRFTNVQRNEVRDPVYVRNVKRAIAHNFDLYLSTSESVQQRTSTILRDVHYVIEAHFDMTTKATPMDNHGKFQDIMRRRLEKGQYYHQPCFGVREFPAYFKPCKEIPPCPEELLGVRDLGWMLLDMDYTNPENITPHFFRASLHDGVMEVPPMCTGEEIR